MLLPKFHADPALDVALDQPLVPEGGLPPGTFSGALEVLAVVNHSEKMKLICLQATLAGDGLHVQPYYVLIREICNGTRNLSNHEFLSQKTHPHAF